MGVEVCACVCRGVYLCVSRCVSVCVEACTCVCREYVREKGTIRSSLRVGTGMTDRKGRVPTSGVEQGQ